MTPTTPIRGRGSPTPTILIPRRGSPRQELLQRRSSRGRTPPWRRALARGAPRSRPSGRPVSIKRPEHGGTIAPRSAGTSA
jgi:hypothetical protein